jgi:hypothetical protein
LDAIRRALHHYGRNLQHPPRIAAHELACPRPVENREPLDRILYAGDELARPFERDLCFRRMDAPALQ